MFIHLVASVQQVSEVLRANGQHRRKTNGRSHRVAPADPVPELEHVRRIDPEFGYFLRICRNRDEMFCNGLFVLPKTGQRPLTSGLGIGHGFECRKSFR